jgi:hypothetical protein
MSRRIPSILLVVLAAVTLSNTALGDAYKGGPAGKYSRPAMAVRAANKDAVWARTIASENGTHIVAWRVKGSADIRVTPIDSQGMHPHLVFSTASGGKIVDVSRSGKSAIVEMTTPSGATRYVAEGLAGKRAHKATIYAPRKLVQERAYFLSIERVKTGAPGSPEGDWTNAEKQLKGR